MYLETARTIIRSIEKSDFENLVKLWTDPEVTRFLGGPRQESTLRKNLQEDLDHPEYDRFNLWPVIHKKDSSFIGHCGLLEKTIEDKNEVELIYILSPAFWRKGLAVEIGCALKDFAKDELGLRRLVSLINPLNTASQKTAEKIGLRWEKDIIRPDNSKKMLYSIQL